MFFPHTTDWWPYWRHLCLVYQISIYFLTYFDIVGTLYTLPYLFIGPNSSYNLLGPFLIFPHFTAFDTMIDLIAWENLVQSRCYAMTKFTISTMFHLVENPIIVRYWQKNFSLIFIRGGLPTGIHPFLPRFITQSFWIGIVKSKRKIHSCFFFLMHRFIFTQF